MPRPSRIEFEHAFYHVMNRGRERCTTFHNDTYFQAFLDTLGEACQRFDCVIHASNLTLKVTKFRKNGTFGKHKGLFFKAL